MIRKAVGIISFVILVICVSVLVWGSWIIPFSAIFLAGISVLSSKIWAKTRSEEWLMVGFIVFLMASIFVLFIGETYFKRDVDWFSENVCPLDFPVWIVNSQLCPSLGQFGEGKPMEDGWMIFVPEHSHLRQVIVFHELIHGCLYKQGYENYNEHDYLLFQKQFWAYPEWVIYLASVFYALSLGCLFGLLSNY